MGNRAADSASKGESAVQRQAGRSGGGASGGILSSSHFVVMSEPIASPSRCNRERKGDANPSTTAIRERKKKEKEGRLVGRRKKKMEFHKLADVFLPIPF